MKGYLQILGLPHSAGQKRSSAPRNGCTTGHQLVAMSASPLMHATGCVGGMMAPHLLGGTSVLLESRHFDPVELWTR